MDRRRGTVNRYLDGRRFSSGPVDPRWRRRIYRQGIFQPGCVSNTADYPRVAG